MIGKSNSKNGVRTLVLWYLLGFVLIIGICLFTHATGGITVLALVLLAASAFITFTKQPTIE